MAEDSTAEDSTGRGTQIHHSNRQTSRLPVLRCRELQLDTEPSGRAANVGAHRLSRRFGIARNNRVVDALMLGDGDFNDGFQAVPLARRHDRLAHLMGEVGDEGHQILVAGGGGQRAVKLEVRVDAGFRPFFRTGHPLQRA